MAKPASLNILVVHGPNLNLLGEREPEVYGHDTLAKIDAGLRDLGKRHGAGVDTFQSNHEGVIVDRLQEARGRIDGLVINPAAFTHTSIAIRDAVLALDVPVIEIHLSNIYRREPFRHKSLIADIAVGQLAGFGARGYHMALEALVEIIRGNKKT